MCRFWPTLLNVAALSHCTVGPEVHERLRTLNKCPLQQARWCVISDYEMTKCENMIMAFAAKNLKPDLNCVKGTSVQDCMHMISTGDADLITLDAADVYVAGKLVSHCYYDTTQHSQGSDTSYSRRLCRPAWVGRLNPSVCLPGR